MTSGAAPIRLNGHRPPTYWWKDLLLGPPLATSRLVRERLRKLVALAVFSSDAISSTAYGTEQIMLVLVAAGVVATRLAFPIALAIGGLLTILVLSYRQTITAYPSSGGAYIVSRDNFGPRWALVAGSALLIDYVLTVAVSVTSGVAALTTALPALQRFVLPLSLAAIGLIMWANLRGVRESGRIFAVPTYLFVGSCAVMLLVGLGRLATGHLDPIPAAGTAPLPSATASVGILLVLHAFAAGCTALTGVEAISNGVPAFRPPEARNARRTLVAMGMILGSLFIGVSFLAVRVGVRPFESGNPTLIGQLAHWVLGGSAAGQAFFYLFQAATLAILVLAANTSFADFPRLVSFAAADAFMPRWFTKRGRRLVHSNGILALSAAAVIVTLAFRADYNRMLPLYAIGVFTSFTLSQAGMTRRHLRLRESGWRHGIVLNGTGALVTLLVLLDIITTKFLAGAWMVLLALPLLVLLLDRINRVYAREREQFGVEAPELLEPPRPRHEVLVLVDGLDRAALHALRYARQLNPLSITALHVAADPDAADRLARLWARLPLTVPLELVHCPNRNLVDCAADAVAERARPDTEVTVLLPRRGDHGRFRRLLHDQTGRDLSDALNRLTGINVAIVHPGDGGPPSGRGRLRSPHRPMSFQLAGMRAAAFTCDPEAMLRCLIIDDSPRFLDAARGLLERQGVAVVGVASNGAEALQRAEELRPDVTLLDIDLGGESGLELARRLHGQASTAAAPVILISTHAEQDYAELIAASPAVGFLPKAALSADAIRRLLAGRGDGDTGDPVDAPSES